MPMLLYGNGTISGATSFTDAVTFQNTLNVSSHVSISGNVSSTVGKFDDWMNRSNSRQRTVLGIAYGFNPYRAGAGEILSTSSTSFVDTGIYCTYTPKRSDSLLFVQCIVQSNVNSSSNQGIQYKIYRDGSNITTGLGGNVESAAFYHDSGHTRDYYGTVPFGWVTTSNSTSTTTFRIYVATWINSSAIRINGHDGISMISVMEIAQ